MHYKVQHYERWYVGVRFSLDILHCLLPLNVTLTPLHLLYLVNFDGENNSEIGIAKRRDFFYFYLRQFGRI